MGSFHFYFFSSSLFLFFRIAFTHRKTVVFFSARTSSTPTIAPSQQSRRKRSAKIEGVPLAHSGFTNKCQRSRKSYIIFWYRGFNRYRAGWIKYFDQKRSDWKKMCFLLLSSPAPDGRVQRNVSRYTGSSRSHQSIRVSESCRFNPVR